MKFYSKPKQSQAAAILSAALVMLSIQVRADSGIWQKDADGVWSDVENWAGGIVADGAGNGAGNGADFSTVDLTANRAVTLDADHTLGAVVFGDAMAPYYNWTVDGTGVLTLAAPSTINVSNGTATVNVPVAGAAGFTKAGAGRLVFNGTNTYSGSTYLAEGRVAYLGNSAFPNGNSAFVVSNAVLEINTTGTLTVSNHLELGGNNGNGLPTNGNAAVIQNAGVFNVGNNGHYMELGAGSNAYGYYELNAGTLKATVNAGASGMRIGATGIGVLVQKGGSLTSSRYFAVGTATGGSGSLPGGVGVATLLGGTATVGTSGSYRIIIGDKSYASGVLNIGTLAGGTAAVSSISTGSGNWGVEFVDQDNADGALNLNNGTLKTVGNVYRNKSGNANFNFNGGTLQAGASGNLIAANAPNLNVYNGGVVIDTQGFNSTNLSAFVLPSGKGIYPATGGFAVTSGGGSAYVGAPLVTITNSGVGSGAMAIAETTDGVVTGVKITCPGMDYAVGDEIGFVFLGGSTNTASSFVHTLTAADLADNTRGGLTKLGSGQLQLSQPNTYSGDTVLAGGTLRIEAEGALGSGNVILSSNTKLVLENGWGDFMNSSANLVLSPGSSVDLNFTGAMVVNGLSLDGGASYVAPGTYGSSASGAANANDTFFLDAGVIEVTSTPTVALTITVASTPNPSIYLQTVTLKASVVSTGGGSLAGTVVFKDGTTTLGSVDLISGSASLVVSNLAIGSHSIVASFGSQSSAVLGHYVNTPTSVWSGAVNGVWDIAATANWTAINNSKVYLDGNYVQLDDSASGNTDLTLATTVTPSGVVVNNDIRAYSISGDGGIAGATDVEKSGSGSLTLGVANAYTGNTTVSEGILTFAPHASSAGNGSLVVGGVNGAIANIDSTNTVNFANILSIGGVSGNTTDTGAGAVRQSSGTVNLTPSGYLEIGAGGTDVYGSYELSGGLLHTLNSTGIRIGAQGTGVFIQTGGELNCERYFAVGSQTGNANIGGNGLATFTGGKATVSSSYRIILGDKPSSTGVLNMGTLAGGDATFTSMRNASGQGGFFFVGDSTATSGTLNLNSGTLELAGAIYRNATSYGASFLNLNGGTLQAAADNTCLVTNIIVDQGVELAGTVYGGGLVVDSQGYNCSIAANLVGATGNGITLAKVLHKVTDGGKGYLGQPLVNVSGGSGIGAMAVATVSNGVVKGVTMTCPGSDYQVGDVLYFDFTSGGATTPAGTHIYTLQASDLYANTNGGLVKLGSGVLNVLGTNTYTGATVVSNGTLAVAGLISGSSALTVLDGATLAGTGIVEVPVIIADNGTLTAGLTNPATLTIQSPVTLASHAVYAVKIDKTLGANDQVQGMTTLTLAGTLNVSLLDGAYAIGDSFKLFDAASYTGSFSAITPATPGTGLAWDASQLDVDGTLKVVKSSVVVDPTPTTLTFGVLADSSLALQWPGSHIGWTLQTQTNSLNVGLSGNWSDVAGSDLTNKIILPLTNTNGCVFYRLILKGN